MRSDRKLLAWGGGALALLIAIAIGADRIAPADPIAQPDAVAGRFLPPGSSRTEIRLADGRSLLAERAAWTPAGLEIERLGHRRVIPAAEIAADDPPTERTFVLGTDRFSRDLLSRLIHGARTSLWVGILAAGLALGLGLLVGGAAGTAGGTLDSVLMRLTDALMAFPQLLIVIVLAALFHASSSTIILILGATGWMAVARLTRAEILTLKEQEFVIAAEAVGRSQPGVLLRHLLPNALTPVIAQTALRAGDLILVEASLSFLGLGTPPPYPTWGNMIAQGADVLTSAWWVAAFPGLAIATTVVALHLLADGLRAWLDPRSRC